MGKQLVDLNIGDTIEVAVKPEYQHYLGESIVWRVADKNHAGYPKNSVTLISDKIIALLPLDAREPKNPNSERKDYGNNYYFHSNMLRWFMSNSSYWYSPNHSYDAPPIKENVSYNPYESWPGFPYMLDQDFISCLLNSSVHNLKPPADGGGSHNFSADYFFLPSEAEIGTETVSGESKFPLFTDDESRKAYCTQAAIDNSDYTNNPTTDIPYPYWLRTPYTGNNHSVRLCNTTGVSNISRVAAVGYSGVRPVCNLSNQAYVKDKLSANGNYVFYGMEEPPPEPEPEEPDSYTPPPRKRLRNQSKSGTFSVDKETRQTLKPYDGAEYDLSLMLNKAVTITGNNIVGFGTTDRPVLGIVSACEYSDEFESEVLVAVNFHGTFSDIPLQGEITGGDFAVTDGAGGLKKSEKFSNIQILDVDKETKTGTIII